MTMGAAAVPLDTLPVGFRFHPTDEELVSHYLKRKINGRIDPSAAQVIPLVDVLKSEPWDLPNKAGFRSIDLEWFFFAAKDRKYAGGSRSNRATEAGYWKATGKDRMIRSRPTGKAAVFIGTKKTLVFHTGRAPKGERTGWIMHEYRTVEPEFEYGAQGGFVLCRLFKKPVEKSITTNVDEMENILSSNAATFSSPVDTQHELDDPGEFTTPSNQEIPLADLPEESQPLADIVVCPTTYPSLSLENSNCTNDTVSYDENHETEMAGVEDDPLDALMHFRSPDYEPLVCDGFPGITSPMRPYTDHPFFEDIKHDWRPQLFEDVNAEHDSVTEFLSSVLGNQEDYSSEVSSTQRDAISGWEQCLLNMPLKKHASPLDSVSGRESASSSDIETDITQASPGFEASEWFYQRPNSVQFQMDISSRNQDVQPMINDSSSMASATHSLCGLYSIEESTNQERYEEAEIKFDTSVPWQLPNLDTEEPTSQENLAHNPAIFEDSGIKVRPRHRRHMLDSSAPVAHQGTAPRRILLQSSFHMGSMPDNILTNSNSDDHEAKKAKTEFLQEGQSTDPNIAGAEVSELASEDELEAFSADGDTFSIETKSILSEIPRKSDPQLRLRKLRADSVGTTLAGLLDPMRSGSRSSSYIILTGPAAIYVACLILFVMVMLCVGIWWCIIPQRMQVSNSRM